MAPQTGYELACTSNSSGAPRLKVRTRARQLYNIVRAHAEEEIKVAVEAQSEETKRIAA